MFRFDEWGESGIAHDAERDHIVSTAVGKALARTYEDVLREPLPPSFTSAIMRLETGQPSSDDPT